jgi:hypothetical protein
MKERRKEDVRKEVLLVRWTVCRVDADDGHPFVNPEGW